MTVGQPLALLALLLALASCASRPVVAWYRHPDTGQVTSCTRAHPRVDSSSLGTAFASVPILGAVGDLIDAAILAGEEAKATSDHAACKSRLEQQGYVRQP